ncbi:MAG: NAD-dependent epimerase/dehydratase family protein [Bacteroidota bacterium]
MKKESRILVAGHRGMVGSAITRALQHAGYSNLILAGKNALDLRNQLEVNEFFRREKPDMVFLAAARVGGIHANNT